MTRKKSLSRPIAVLDIGSNSVRLGVFLGKRMIFSEKVQCRLGRNTRGGRLNAKASNLARAAIMGFLQIAKSLEARDVRAIATAAIRDATDGPKFIRDIERKTGVKIRVISGEEEARLAALGVLYGNPKASGIVVDLGGGSLELAWLKSRRIGQTLSLPLGALRLLDTRRDLSAMLETEFSDLPKIFKSGAPLYLVGGNFRALARLQMKVSRKAEKVQGYTLTRSKLKNIFKLLKNKSTASLVADYDVDPFRATTLPASAVLLQKLMNATRAQKVVVSTYGIRDGLLLADRKKLRS